MSFKWHPDEPPPQIESHSKAKLRVLRSYLRAYFDRLNVNPQREEFRLDLVDGFAGGGLFADGAATMAGTPIIMLEETAAATKRLNEGRVKPLNVNCRFYFVDKEAAHTAHLSNVIKERELDAAERVTVRTGRFEDEVDGILQSIKARQPRAGRALFLLDQTGFGQVELALVQQIFSELAAAEVILTFAADALINHLATTPQIVSAVRPLELDESRIRELIRARDENTSRAVVQRALRDHVRHGTGAVYDTPFFIRPDQIQACVVVPAPFEASNGPRRDDPAALGCPEHVRALRPRRLWNAGLGRLEGLGDATVVPFRRGGRKAHARATVEHASEGDLCTHVRRPRDDGCVAAHHREPDGSSLLGPRHRNPATGRRRGVRDSESRGHRASQISYSFARHRQNCPAIGAAPCGACRASDCCHAPCPRANWSASPMKRRAAFR